MSEQNVKKVKTRIVHKHDIAENWERAVNFVPKQGELIIYDDRYIDSDNNVHIVASAVRYKIGDGVTHVNDLHFTDENILLRLKLLEELIDTWMPSDRINGIDVFDAGLVIDDTTSDYIIFDSGVII